MTIDRAICLAEQWANGHVCTLRDSEAKDYHRLCLAALRAAQQEPNERLTLKELREIDFGLVWVRYRGPIKVGKPWGVIEEPAIVRSKRECIETKKGTYIPFRRVGIDAEVYRRKPEALAE